MTRLSSNDRRLVAGAVASALLGFSMLHASHVLTSPAHVRAGERVLVVHTAGGDLRLHVAADRQQRRAGLMNDTPRPGTGELFVWRAAGLRHFWMANTPAPLDMVFMDSAGLVTRVLAGVPPCVALPCPVYSHHARYVIELPAFTAAPYGLRPGTHLQGLAGLR